MDKDIKTKISLQKIETYQKVVQKDETPKFLAKWSKTCRFVVEKIKTMSKSKLLPASFHSKRKNSEAFVIKVFWRWPKYVKWTYKIFAKKIWCFYKPANHCFSEILLSGAFLFSIFFLLQHCGCKKSSPIRHLKFKISLLVTNHLWQISFFQTSTNTSILALNTLAQKKDKSSKNW